MAVSRVRYVYETFFEDNTPWIPPPDQFIDTVVNHPSVRKMMRTSSSQEAQRGGERMAAKATSTITTTTALVHHLDPSLEEESDHSVYCDVHHQQQHQQRRSSASSLHTICSLADEADDEMILSENDGDDDSRGLLLLNRSHSLQQTHLLHPDASGRRGFSLYLSPKQRMRVGEAILSPISDKSETNESNSTEPSANLTVTPVPSLSLSHRQHQQPSSSSSARRPLSLFGLPKPSGFANSSDSGISISANSLATSHEALQPQPPSRKSLVLSFNNSHEFLGRPSSEQGENRTDEETLPFLMPKLHRSSMANSQQSDAGEGAAVSSSGAANGRSGGGGLSISFDNHPAAVRQLSLTLPFPNNLPLVTTVANESCNIPVYKDLADDTAPLDTQSWYHGSITRRDAEFRLKPSPAGTFLIRDSLDSHYHYFLAARGENGFLHVQIYAHEADRSECDGGASSDSEGKDFSLATLPERRFPSVAAIINHCAKIGIYCPRFPPVVLKYPLADESL